MPGIKSLKDRNQAGVGAVAVILLLLSMAAAYTANDLPLIGGGATYSAYFAESAGLAPDNEVQIAGVRVGQVKVVELDRKTVLVTFRIDREGQTSAARLGDATTASIEIKTMLGEKFLALQPRGDGNLDPNEPIPVARTRTPFQLQDAFDQLNTTIEDIDTDQLAASFTVISETFADTPEHLQDALNGLSDLSETVASRDDELGTLLGNTNEVSALLAGRNDELRKVIGDSNLLLDELQRRKGAIDRLLSGTQAVSKQLSGLVADNRAQLRPSLAALDQVTDVLRRNQDNLNRSLELLAPFTRVGTNATGNGRWFDGYLCGLVPPAINAEGVTVNPQGCESPLAAPNQGIEGGN